MKFTIGNICKEVQRIKFDIECEYMNSAKERCDALDELLCSIEDGEHELEIGDVVLVK